MHFFHSRNVCVQIVYVNIASDWDQYKEHEGEDAAIDSTAKGTVAENVSIDGEYGSSGMMDAPMEEDLGVRMEHVTLTVSQEENDVLTSPSAIGSSASVAESVEPIANLMEVVETSLVAAAAMDTDTLVKENVRKVEESKGEEETVPRGSLAEYFHSLVEPCPRINPCLMIRYVIAQPLMLINNVSSLLAFLI